MLPQSCRSRLQHGQVSPAIPLRALWPQPSNFCHRKPSTIIPVVAPKRVAQTAASAPHKTQGRGSFPLPSPRGRCLSHPRQATPFRRHRPSAPSNHCPAHNPIPSPTPAPPSTHPSAVQSLPLSSPKASFRPQAALPSEEQGHGAREALPRQELQHRPPGLGPCLPRPACPFGFPACGGWPEAGQSVTAGQSAAALTEGAAEDARGLRRRF